MSRSTHTEIQEFYTVLKKLYWYRIDIGIGRYSEFLVSDRYRFWKSGIEPSLVLSNSLACAQQQSSYVLSENRAEKLGGFKRVLRELNKWIYELINYMNVPLKVLTVFRNNSIAFCFHFRSM